MKTLLLFIAVWLTCVGVARAQDPDELPPNPEMQRQELVNLEKENAADQSSWIAAIWSTRSLTKFVRVARGGCCPKILVLGKPSMATSVVSIRVGCLRKSTTVYARESAKPRGASVNPVPPSLTRKACARPSKAASAASMAAS